MPKNILNTLKEIAEKNLRILKNDVVRAVIITVVVILVIGVSGYVVYFKDNSGGIKVLTAEAISQKTINYINDNILKGQGTVSLKGEVKEENGLYKFILTFDVNDQKQDSDVYVTRDGKYLFPVMQGLPIDLDEKPIIQEPTSGSSGSNLELTISPNELTKFISCLKKADFVIYGANWCGWTNKLVTMLGGLDMIKPIYVECTENEKLCQERGIQGYPTILVNGKEYQKSRTFTDFAETTGCEIPLGAESVPQDATDGGCE